MRVLSTSMHPSQSLGDAVHVSAGEAARMEAVRRYAILDTPAEGAFDRITRLAAQLFDVPMAIVSIVDHDRIWFKSVHGLEGVTQIGRDPGLCSTAIEGDEPYVLADARDDERSAANPLVSGPFGLRFYAGVPLRTTDGFNLGTLCVIDREPHQIDIAKIDMLATLAKVVVDELELRLAARRAIAESPQAGEPSRRDARIDAVTALGNRTAFDQALDRFYASFMRGEAPQGTLALVELDGLDGVVAERGRDAGDRLLASFASALATEFDSHAVFRYGGSEFVVLFDRAVDHTAIEAGIGATMHALREIDPADVRAFCGITDFAEVNGSPRVTLRLADSRMYAAKVAART